MYIKVLHLEIIKSIKFYNTACNTLLDYIVKHYTLYNTYSTNVYNTYCISMY